METTAHYIRVGIFVIIFTIFLIIGLLWLSFGLNGKAYKYYFVYMHESVAGLSLRSAVKYNGVDVGFVQDIDLYQKNPQQVQILLEIEDTVPIYNGTRAVLETQGITGISYIELQGGEIKEGKLKVRPGERYPVIKSAPSLLFRLGSAVDNLTKNVENITRNLQVIINDKNAQAISTTLENFSAISTNLRDKTGKLDQLIDDAQITLQNTANASKQLPNIMTKVQHSAESIDKAADSFASASRQAEAIVRNGAVTLETVNNQLMPQAVSSMYSVQTLLNNLTHVSQQMEENPAVIIRGRQSSPPGPGE